MSMTRAGMIAHSMQCPNCETELSGRYCSNCGQRAAELRPTLHELLHEALEELSHVDGKVLRTIGLLLFRPGQLTVEFFAGKRARSVTPLRLYLLASVLFFGALALQPAKGMRLSVNKADPRTAQLARAAERLNRDPAVLSHQLETAFPKAMFVLMPIFGVLVYAFYWRTERKYVPHFYFAVHYHAFVFLMLALFEAVRLLHWRPLRIASLAFLLVPLPYLAVALRKVYRGGRSMTVAKTIAIVALDLACVLIAMAAIALVVLLRYE